MNDDFRFLPLFVTIALCSFVASAGCSLVATSSNVIFCAMVSLVVAAFGLLVFGVIYGMTEKKEGEGIGKTILRWVGAFAILAIAFIVFSGF